MGTTAERMMSARSSRGGKTGGAFIGFDEKDIKKEFERAFKELENLHDGVTTAQIRRIARKSLKPMLKAYKEEAKAKSKRDFVVYRNGGIYAEIKPGTLSKSMGIITTKVNRGSTFASLQVGPRVKRSFSDPEKGGWFAHFLEYGYLQDGGYKSGIQGFAKRARMKNSSGVGNEFKRLMRSFLNKKVKSARV
jgi:predicted Zn-dependent peptidase